MAPFYEQKQKLWAAAGLDSTATVSLTLTDPLPKNVLRYLRIQRLGPSDLAVLRLKNTDAADKKVNVSNEMEVLQFLVDSIDGLLQSFGTQLEKLEEQLAKDVYTPGSNAWAAAHVSVGEQRVLRLAKTKAESLLEAVESGSEDVNGVGKDELSARVRCVNCGKDSMPLMLCGRCKTVIYCGRTCQVVHYKEHKEICRAIVSRNGQ